MKKGEFNDVTWLCLSEERCRRLPWFLHLECQHLMTCNMMHRGLPLSESGRLTLGDTGLNWQKVAHQAHRFNP